MSLRTRFFVLVAAGAIATSTVAYLLHFRFLDNLERQTIDLRFSLRGDEAPPKDVVIVKVDDVTFTDHRQWRWPFDRKLHAQMLDQIRKGHPKAIAFDIQFSELGSVAGDNALGVCAPSKPRQDRARDDRGDGNRRAEPHLQPRSAQATRRARGEREPPDRPGRDHPSLPLSTSRI